MTTATIDHIVIDDKGRAKVKGTRVKVTHLVGAKVSENLTMEQLFDEFPDLAPSAIHAAFAYYYDHKEELDREIEESLQRYEEARKANQQEPHVKRLKEIKKQQRGNS